MNNKKKKKEEISHWIKNRLVSSILITSTEHANCRLLVQRGNVSGLEGSKAGLCGDVLSVKHRGRCVQLHSWCHGPGMPLGGSKPGWGVGRVGFCTGCLSRLGIWGQRAEEAARGWQKLLFPCKSGQHFGP